MSDADTDATVDVDDSEPTPSPTVTCEPIGVVYTPFEAPADAPRQGSEAGVEGTVVVDEAFADGLRGMEAGRPIDVVWWATAGDRDRLLLRDGERGVFTTRAPHRPNPVCVTPVDVLEIDGRRLRVRGVDMLSGTPVLDLKARLR